MDKSELETLIKDNGFKIRKSELVIGLYDKMPYYVAKCVKNRKTYTIVYNLKIDLGSVQRPISDYNSGYKNKDEFVEVLKNVKL